MHGLQLHGTNRENRCCSLISKWELLLSLCGVLCAAEVFVVTQASDKASCSSWAKSRTSPQGPQVGVGSPAALCARFIIWKHTGRETDGERHTQAHIEASYFHILTFRRSAELNWGSGISPIVSLYGRYETKEKCRTSTWIFFSFLHLRTVVCGLCLEGNHFIFKFHRIPWPDERWVHLWSSTLHQCFVCSC